LDVSVAVTLLIPVIVALVAVEVVALPVAVLYSAEVSTNIGFSKKDVPSGYLT
jgi:hypothetical protein